MNRIPKLFWAFMLACLLALAGLSMFLRRQGESFIGAAERITEASDLESLKREEDRVAGLKVLTRQQRQALYGLLAGRYAQLGDVPKMQQLLEQILARDPDNAEVLNNLAYEWAKQGVNLERAEQHARRAVELVESGSMGSKPVGMTRERWQQLADLERGNYRDTYGWVLYQQGRHAESLAELQKAFGLAPEPVIQHHLGMALYSTGDREGAIENLASSLAGRLEDPQGAMDALERAYKEKHGSLRGLDQLLKDSAEKSLARQQAEEDAAAAKIVGQPAPDFALPDLDGQIHKLSQYRGQVVILDFWATWCGPCRMAMPQVNQTFLEHRDRGVSVFAINLEGRDKEQLVRDFIERAGYQFVVLQGGMMGIGIDQPYGVTGIPTTFVIDRQGVVRYRHIGYREDLGKMLSRQVEELLKQ
jgi:thiol-disulfide isomerase/thioredoxin